MSERPLLDSLRALYGQEPVKQDVWGRRDALPSEVQRVLQGGELGFEEQVNLYPPTMRDILVKEDERRTGE